MKRTCNDLGACQLAEYGECKGACVLADAAAKEMPVQFVGPEPDDEPLLTSEGVIDAMARIVIVLAGVSLAGGLVASVIYAIVQRAA